VESYYAHAAWYPVPSTPLLSTFGIAENND